MRLAVCALSAVLLSGCSWLGMGGNHGDSYGYQYGHGGMYGQSGAQGCPPGYMYKGGHAQYQMMSAQSGCVPGAGYSVAHSGYMSTGTGYGAAATGYGATGMSSGYGYGASTTTLSSAAPYGAAVGGQAMSGGVQTVQGAPIYVPQPYPSYYGVPALRGAQAGCCGPTGGAMPFGLEAGVGTEFDIGGDLFEGKGASPNNPDLGLASAEVVAPQLKYSDVFDQGVVLGGGLGYDLNRNTTLLGNVSYQKNDGKAFDNGTFQPGTYDALGNFTASGPAEAITGSVTDLEQWTVEAGVRQYIGYNPSVRPYVGATAGMYHNNDVDITQSSTTLGTFTQPLLESGWNPTAAGVVGAEMAVGNRMAVGVETGVRWRSGMDGVIDTGDRWTVPLSLRGRVAF